MNDRGHNDSTINMREFTQFICYKSIFRVDVYSVATDYCVAAWD